MFAIHAGRCIIFEKYIKAKDSPWDADLTGSVVSTVGAKLLQMCNITKHFCKIIFIIDIFIKALNKISGSFPCHNPKHDATGC